jgi:glutamate synthase (NADPH/NADH) large chain
MTVSPPVKQGLYDPAFEHDSCGVGFVVDMHGRPSHTMIELGLGTLCNLDHRGATGAEANVGDGAGMLVQVPDRFLRAVVDFELPPVGQYAVGCAFLPQDAADAEQAMKAIEKIAASEDLRVLGWRDVPFDDSMIGSMARDVEPTFRQLFLSSGTESGIELDRRCFVARKRFEHETTVYFPSLSSRTLVYKGMLSTQQLLEFFPDIADERFESAMVLVHSRFSTNTFPSWPLAHPYRYLAHNGEINTLKGNVNWMKAHETRMATPIYGDRMDDVKPIIQPGGSDSAALDNVFEAMVGVGRNLPMVKCLLIPDSWAERETMPKAHRDFYSYCNSVMEPWDGPAAICGFAGSWAIAGMDRNGLRPLRYTITEDGLLLAGSETGMVKVEESRVAEKGRLGPGQMIAVDLAAGRLYRDRELKDMLVASAPFSRWVENIIVIDSLVRSAPGEPASMEREELRRRQLGVGCTIEELELVLHPMVEDAKEAVISMGDDTPLAVLAQTYRGLHHFFRQNFSQARRSIRCARSG